MARMYTVWPVCVIRTQPNYTPRPVNGPMVSHYRMDSEMPAPVRIAPPFAVPRPVSMGLLAAEARELGIELDDVQVGRFQLYYEEILSWNRRVNLTRVTDPDEVRTRHFIDSLSVLRGLSRGALGAGTSLIDVGSGAGLPGVPLKIAYPAVSLVLLEANGKRAAFLGALVAALDLEDARVVHARAEDAGRRHDLRDAFDVVVSRAVAPLEVLAELTLPFCRVGGVAIAQKGADVDDELDRAGSAIAALGGGESRTHSITPPGGDVARSLVVTEKARATPDKFPRRPGIPAKRPL